MKKIIFYLLLVSSVFTSTYAESISDAHNSKLPVEVTGDTLEVLKEQQKAIFTGSVEAKQGNITLKSDKMTIYYKDNKEKKAAKSDKDKGISKVETVGHVLLKTPKESASGDLGLFDVDQNVVTITGNVVLTSDENTVKGDKLTYNLTTGQSSVISNSDASGAKKGRVRGVFTPKRN